MGVRWLAVCAALIALAGVAPAEPVVITTFEGLRLEGEPLSFDGRNIRLQTIYGPMLVDMERADCIGDGCPDAERFVPDVRLSGEPSLTAVMAPALIEAYARQSGFALKVVQGVSETIFLIEDTGQVHLRLRLLSVPSETALAQLLAGETEIVLSAREVRADERAAFRNAGLGDLTDDRQSQILGLTGLVPVISPRRQLRQVSLNDLARVVSGEIRDFGELGGAPGEITLYLGPQGNGFEQGFADKLLGPTGQVVRSDAVRMPDENRLWQAVNDDQNGFGLVRADRIGSAQPLSIAGGCGLRIAADATLLMTEDYPVTLPVFVYVPDLPRHPAIADFLRWLNTSSAARVIGRTGLAGLASEEIPLSSQGERLANAIRQAGSDVSLGELQRLMRVLEGAVRLTPTFRFEVGSTRLDAQSRVNVQRLAAEISSGRYEGQRILLIGFSDSRGPADANRELSAARAEVILRRLEEVMTSDGGAVLDTVAFGEALPMACDDTEAGRQVNRRVEVWLVPQR